MTKILFEKSNNLQTLIHPHCNTSFCSQRIIELNPTIGCEFKCQYCCVYTQDKHYDFKEVTVFKDYPELLEEYININKQNLSNKFFFFSFESDCFQNVLIESGITLEIIKILVNNNCNYFLLTKGTPNNDIIQQLIKSKQLCQIVLNDTMPNEKYREKLEPGTATLQQRFDFALLCHENKIRTSISFSPIFPFFNKEYLEEKIVNYSKIGIHHFRLDMLEMSDISIKKMIELCPEYKNEIEEMYLVKEPIISYWNVPNSEKRIKRYLPNKEEIARIYFEIKTFAKGIDSKNTVSICDGTVNKIDMLFGFNQEAHRCNMNCMGIKTN